MEKITPQKQEEMNGAMTILQSRMGAIMLSICNVFGAKEYETHTEVAFSEKSEQKFLVSRTLRPLTKELRDEIMKRKNEGEN